MEPDPPPDHPDALPPEFHPATAEPQFVPVDGDPQFVPVAPVAAEAAAESVPAEALPPPPGTDQVLAAPVPAEMLSGSDPADLLATASVNLPTGTEVVVPSLEEVTAVDDVCLAGGGEMGALMRSFDWSQSPIGPVAEWPPSLRFAVSLMLASSFPMLIAWGREYTQLYNDAYRPVLGTTKHPAALGRRARDSWPEIWDAMLGPMFEQVMASGEPFKSEDRLFVLDRAGYLEEAYFTFSFSAIRDETGRPAGVLATSVETTERVLGERRLRTLRELAAMPSGAETVGEACQIIADTLSSNSHDLPFALLYLIDNDGGRADLCTSVHLPRGTTATPEIVSLSGADDGDAVVWPIARVAQSEQSEVISNLSSRVGRLPGGPWPEGADAALAAPVKSSGTQRLPAGVLVAGISPRRALDHAYRDFLELVAAQIATTLSSVRAHEVERQRAESLAELDRAKTMFFSNVSDELRTPLTLMIGPAGDLLAGDHGPLAAGQREQIQILRRNSARLLKMVNTLLDFSQIEIGRFDATFEPTDLAAFTSELASVLRSAVERAGLALGVDCPPLDEPVYVDRDMWEKIVLNLLSNALKFTFAGRIDVTLRTTDAYVELVVSDTGIGISPADLRYVFTHFHRVRGARARSQEGSGIGLALVHELARIHGGSVNVVSEPGEGTSFRVCLRKGQSHLPADRIRRSRPLTSTPRGAAPFVEEALRWVDETPPDDSLLAHERNNAADGSVGVAVRETAQSARVLIADDHADMRHYLMRLLGRRWTVDAVGDGLSVLSAVREQRPDLIVADVMMPGLDGFALMRELRADPATSTIPVLLLSARAGEAAKVEGIRAGAADYLVKPFLARELVAKVQSQIEHATFRRQADVERARLRSLFNDAPVPICILRGAELRYEFVNPPYARLFGNRDLLGKTVREALPEMADQESFEALHRVFHTGETFWGIEVPMCLKLSEHDTDPVEEFFFNFVYQAMRGPRGEVEGIVVFAVDVTEQVLARRKIEESIQTRDTFFAAAAHELRNPINALQLQLLSILRAADRDATALPADWVQGRVGKAAQQVSRLIRLVDNLLDVSRIASGRLHLDFETVDLAVAVAEAVDRLEPSEQAQIVKILEPAVGHWDRMRIDQIVTNLVSNALKYGEGRPIEVMVKSLSSGALLEVSDQGIGIAAEHQERIFDRFERAVADRRYAGFGLGLWITSRIVEAFGGSMSVRSEAGAGSTFIVQLPTEPGRT